MSSITATLNLSLGNVSASVNKAASLVRRQLKPLADLNSSFGNLKKSFDPLLPVVRTAFTAIKGGAVVAAAGIAGIGYAISKAADMEQLETAFVPLLGGVDEAQARIKELSEFAANTPFELPEVATASRTLEVLTKGALSTGDGLRLVGDVASGTNQPFQDLAMWIGRLYDGLQNGRPVGEAMMRLQEMGAISGGTRSQIEAMQKSGANGDAVWGAAASALNRYTGSMKAQSMTWSGMLSNFKDNIGMALAAFGAPILDSLKPYLGKLISLTSTLSDKAKAIGQTIASGIDFITEAFAEGQIWNLAKMGLELAFKAAVNTFVQLLAGVAAYLLQALNGAFRTALQVLGFATKPAFWAGLGAVLVGLAAKFSRVITDAIAALLAKMESLPVIGEKMKGVAQSLRTWGAERAKMGGEVASGGASLLAPFAQQLVADETKRQGENSRAFSTAYANSGGVLDVSGLKNQIADIRDQISIRARAAALARQEAQKEAMNATAKNRPPDVSGVAASTTAAAKSYQLTSIGSFGLFLKRRDPLLTQAQRQTKAVEEMNKSLQAFLRRPLAGPSGPLVFS